MRNVVGLAVLALGASMRLAYRLNLLLIAGVAAVSMGFAYYQVRTERRSLERDLQRQALNLAESLGKAAEAPLERHSYRELQALVDRFKNRERLAGIAVYDQSGKLVAITAGLESRLNGIPPSMLEEATSEGSYSAFIDLGGAPMYVTAVPLLAESVQLGTLSLFHDAAYIDQRTAEAWRRDIASVSLQVLLIGGVTLLTMRWAVGQPLVRMTQWLREVRTGAGPPTPNLPVGA